MGNSEEIFYETKKDFCPHTGTKALNSNFCGTTQIDVNYAHSKMH